MENAVLIINRDPGYEVQLSRYTIAIHCGCHQLPVACRVKAYHRHQMATSRDFDIIMGAKHLFAVVILCLGMLLSNSTIAQRSLPFFSDSLVQAPDPTELPVPDPRQLEPGWWRYFAVEGEQLETQINNTLEGLDRLMLDLSGDLRASASPFVELIRANLRALPQTLNLKPEPSSQAQPRSPRESYTVGELLDLHRQLREKQLAIQEERRDIRAAEEALGSLKNRVDTLMAAYLSRSSQDAQRLLQGLEIMAETSRVAVAEARLLYRQTQLVSQDPHLEQLEAEINLAAETLTAGYPELVRLAAEIDQAETTLEQAQDRLLSHQTTALNLVGDGPEARATEQFRRSRVVRSTVATAAAQIRLIRLQAEQAIVRILLEDVQVDSDALRNDLRRWRTSLRTIRRDAEQWTQDSEQERDRTGAAVAAVPDQMGGLLDSVQLINQDRFRLAQESLVAIQTLQQDIQQVDVLITQVERRLLALDGRLRDWLARGSQWLNQLWSDAGDWISTSLFRIGETPVTAVGLLRIVLFITVAWWISYWLRRALMQLGERREGVNLSAYYTVGRLSHYVLMTVGLMVGLSSIGMDFTNFALVAGALGIGIGFGLQPIVNNFLSGLILLFERSLKVGDFVELASGVEGEVREINVRSTLINTNDNVDIVVPNSEFMNTNVVNWTLMENYRRIHLPFRVAFGTDKDIVRQAGLEAAERVPHTLTGIPGKNPGVWLVAFGDNGLEFELVVWITYRAVKRPGAVQAAYMWEIESALRRYDVHIPLPQRDLHIRSGLQEALRNLGRGEKKRPRLEKAAGKTLKNEEKVSEKDPENKQATSEDVAIRLEKG